MGTLSLLHTTDLHGRLGPGRVRRLRELRQERAALLLDSGDALTAPNVLVWPWREPIWRWMNAAGYSAMAAGNREFFFRRWGLRHQVAPAAFPVLAANLRTRRCDPALPPSVMLDTPAGDRLGVLGLAREMIRPGAWGERGSDLRFVPWPGAAQEAVAALRGQVRWLVALSHLGVEQDRELARLCPALDLILSGHEHPVAGWVESLGTVTLVVSTAGGREVTAVRSRAAGPPGDFAVERIRL